MLDKIGRSVVRTTNRDPELAQELGIGTVQLEALGAWMRLAGLTATEKRELSLSHFGQLLQLRDPGLREDASWWAMHWQLANNYIIWALLGSLPDGLHEIEAVDRALAAERPDVSPHTISNARAALVLALDQTPLGQSLGLVQLQSDERRVVALDKLRISHGQAPMAAVAYALLDWAQRNGTSGAALESLANHGGPGPILHMSDGVIERYLMDIHHSYDGRVLSYSRTAGLDQASFRADVDPLHVLASHYLHEREGLSWTAALEKAQQEEPPDDGD